MVPSVCVSVSALQAGPFDLQVHFVIRGIPRRISLPVIRRALRGRVVDAQAFSSVINLQNNFFSRENDLT